MRLTVMSGPSVGAFLDVTQAGGYIGRASACALRVDDPAAADWHVHVQATPEGRAWLQDAGHGARTFVNGRPLTAPVLVSGGEQVHVGHTLLVPQLAAVGQGPAPYPASPAPASPPAAGSSRTVLDSSARNRRLSRRMVALLVFIGLFGALQLFIDLLGLGAPLYFVAWILAALPIPLYLALALWIDRYEPEPFRLLAVAFLWGATVAVLFSGIANGVLGVVFAPVVEETLKGLILVAIFLWKREEFNGVVDGLVYAAMVGLGFTLVEDLSYYGRAYAESGVGALIGNFIQRGVLSAFGHPVFTGMLGIGFGLAVQSRNPAVRVLAPIGGLVAAIVLHALWNSAPGLVGLVILGPVFMLTWGLVTRFAMKREGRIVRENLHLEVAHGLLSIEELERLSSVRQRTRVALRAARRGRASLKLHGDFQSTAGELALHRHRVAVGLEPAGPVAAEVEAGHVRRLWELRGQLDPTVWPSSTSAGVFASYASEDATAASAGPAAGWYPDTSGHARIRWWDGVRWSEYTAS